MQRIVRVELDGADTAAGRLAATDFAKLILNLQAALRRAAHVVLGRPRLAVTGRYEAVVEDATRLRFVGIDAGHARGGVAGVLALPDVGTAPDALDVDVSLHDLGYLALRRLLDAVDSPADDLDPALARAVAQLAEDVNVGGRTTRVLLRAPAGEGQPARMVSVDEGTRYRMQDIAGRAQRRSNILHGRLMEADFEKNRARLRLADGTAVPVVFDDNLADEIQVALRTPNTFAADVGYHGESGIIVGVALRAIVSPSDQLQLDFAAATDPDQLERLM